MPKVIINVRVNLGVSRGTGKTRGKTRPLTNSPVHYNLTNPKIHQYHISYS